MRNIAAPLGFIALLGMAASHAHAQMPDGPAICYGGREVPKKQREQPGGCHAVMGCAAHRLKQKSRQI